MKKLFLFAISYQLLAIGFLHAQNPVLLKFTGSNGANPTGDVTLSANGKVLYGMTQYGGGGGFGNIFAINTNGTGYKDLLDFNGNTNGAYPGGNLTLIGNKLFGMTAAGGANDSGCIFSIDTNGNSYKDLFDFNGANGSTPFGSVTITKAKMYGMTYQGGTNSMGCIFSADTNGSNYKILLNFSGANGANPIWYLTLSGKMLYGMTSDGGLNQDGNVFCIDTNGTLFKDLLDFNGTNGAIPSGSLVVSGNMLYGMSPNGGANFIGSVFALDTNGSAFTDLLDFNGTNGAIPFGSLTLSGKTLYGMTSLGGVNDSGNIFCIDTNGNGFRDMLDFNSTDGYFPQGDITLSITGDTLFGMTDSGGVNQNGVIFDIDTNSVAGISVVRIQNSEFRIFPNPNNGKFTIAISQQPSANSQVEIYNMLGEKVYDKQWTINNGQCTIDLNNNTAGIYMYRVLSEAGNLIGAGKFVIEH